MTYRGAFGESSLFGVSPRDCDGGEMDLETEFVLVLRMPQVNKERTTQNQKALGIETRYRH